jgi:hypothetical protein
MERIPTALVVAEGHPAYTAPSHAWEPLHITIYLHKHPRLPSYPSGALPQTTTTLARLYCSSLEIARIYFEVKER